MTKPWRRRSVLAATLADIGDHKGLAAALAVTFYLAPVAYSVWERLSRDPMLELWPTLGDEIAQPLAGAAAAGAVLFFYAVIVVPVRQRNAERRENDRLNSRPRFSISTTGYGRGLKGASVHLRNEDWISDDTRLYFIDDFRITNKTEVPIQLSARLVVQKHDATALLSVREWRSVHPFSLYRGEGSSALEGANYLDDPMHVGPFETISGTLLFMDFGGKPLDQQELVLQLVDYQSDLSWRVPLGKSLSAEELDQYVQEEVDA